MRKNPFPSKKTVRKVGKKSDTQQKMYRFFGNNEVISENFSDFFGGKKSKKSLKKTHFLGTEKHTNLSDNYTKTDGEQRNNEICVGEFLADF